MTRWTHLLVATVLPLATLAHAGTGADSRARDTAAQTTREVAAAEAEARPAPTPDPQLERQQHDAARRDRSRHRPGDRCEQDHDTLQGVKR